MQADAAGDEAPAEDIDHSDEREQSPPVAPAAAPMLQRFSRDCQPLRRYNTHDLSYSLIQVNWRAIRRYRIARKNRNDSRQFRYRWILWRRIICTIW